MECVAGVIGSNREMGVVASWDGQESVSRQTQNSVFGLLLDFDEGTLSVYKNGRRLGTMKSVFLVNTAGL